MCPRAADALSNQEHTTESATKIADESSVYYRHTTAEWCFPHARSKQRPVVCHRGVPGFKLFEGNNGIDTTDQADVPGGVSPLRHFIDGPRDFVLQSAVWKIGPESVLALLASFCVALVPRRRQTFFVVCFCGIH